VTAATGWLAAWDAPGLPGAAGVGVAALPQAVASRTLATANPMSLLRIDDLLHL
jgi:hypothetical protein